MEEKVRRDVAALFGQHNWGRRREYVSLKLLDKFNAEHKPNAINLELLDKIQPEKEEYIPVGLLDKSGSNETNNGIDRIGRIISLRMLDKIAEGNEHINTNILEKPFIEETIHLGILEQPVAAPHERCYLLSPLMECNVGGSAHAGCMDQHFHSHCTYKALYEKRVKRRKTQPF